MSKENITPYIVSKGEVFIFINKPLNRIKLLHWERGEYLLYYKRMAQDINYDSLRKIWELEWENEDLQADLDKKMIENLYLKQELARLNKAIFGSKSERFVSSEEQSPLQLSLDLNMPEPLPITPQKETITYEGEKPSEEKKEIPFRGAFPADLPREEVIVKPEVIPVGAKKIGEEISDQLEFNPGTIYVKSTIRPKYVLPKEQGETESKIIIAELPIGSDARPGQLSKVGLKYFMSLMNNDT